MHCMPRGLEVHMNTRKDGHKEGEERMVKYVVLRYWESCLRDKNTTQEAEMVMLVSNS